MGKFKIKNPYPKAGTPLNNYMNMDKYKTNPGSVEFGEDESPLDKRHHLIGARKFSKRGIAKKKGRGKQKVKDIVKSITEGVKTTVKGGVEKVKDVATGARRYSKRGIAKGGGRGKRKVKNIVEQVKGKAKAKIKDVVGDVKKIIDVKKGTTSPRRMKRRR